MSEGLGEIRILGTLRVRRADGAAVEHREWRTGKTRDLLRLLALRAGHPVSVEELVATLWPGADHARGRASLRTAASQVRRVLGGDCLAREGQGLVLRGVWVDVAHFEALVEAARACFARNDLAEGVRTTRQAAAMFVGDLSAEESEADWAALDRERLSRLLTALLVEAAEAALGLGWLRDALDLAARVLERDPFSERAYRALMRAHFGLGDTEVALGLFERCRHVLAEELGADPAPATQALHVQLLSSAEPHIVAAPFAGRSAEIAAIRERVAAAHREGYALLVVLTGPAGIGKSHLAQEACRPWAEWQYRVECTPAITGRPRALVCQLLEELATDEHGEPTASHLERVLDAVAPAVVLVDDVQWADPDSLELLGTVLATASQPIAVVATLRTPRDGVAALPEALAGLRRTGRASIVAVGPLGLVEVAQIVESQLRGVPAPELVADIHGRTRGVPNDLLNEVRALGQTGRVVATSRGLVAAAREGAQEPDVGDALLARVRTGLSPPDAELLELAAVLSTDFTVDTLADLIDGMGRAAVRAALDVLEDTSVLVRTGGLYRFRHPLLREAVYGWLRPSRRRCLHQRIAEAARIPAAARIDHWDAAGEPRLACAAALQAADEARFAGDIETALAHLLRVRALTDLTDATATDRLEFLEILADTCLTLSRFVDAHAALAEALDSGPAPAVRARLSRKVGDLHTAAGDPDEAVAWYRRAQRAGDHDDDAERCRIAVALASRLSLEDPQKAEPGLRDAVTLADRADDLEARVVAHARLAGRGLGLRRLFDAGAAEAAVAIQLAVGSGDEGLIARAEVHAAEAYSWLGEARRVEGPLRRLCSTGAGPLDSPAHTETALLRCLAAHELGQPEFAVLWGQVWPSSALRSARTLVRWVALRVLIDRGDLNAAAREAQRLADGRRTPFGRQLFSLPLARLEEAMGRPERAAVLLTEALDIGRGTGLTLLLPEIGARLSALQAPHNPRAAAARLERAEAALGSAAHGREQAAILLARAGLQAARGRREAAVDLAAAAVAAARNAGLVFSEAEALLMQAGHLESAELPLEAAECLGRADALYEAAGAPAAAAAVRASALRVDSEYALPGA